METRLALTRCSPYALCWPQKQIRVTIERQFHYLSMIVQPSADLPVHYTAVEETRR
jgi:hypothetical protein